MKKGICIVTIIAATALTLQSCGRDDCKDKEKEWQEAVNTEKKASVTSTPLDVFIENSGSIDGYVSGMNLFKTDTYALISNSVVEKPSLNFINSQISHQNTTPRDFILNLTVSRFRSSGGNYHSTDIADIIEKSMKNSYKTPAVLVSDFIFSPDADHREDVEAYFELQKNDISNTIMRLLKQNSNLAVVVYQGISEFKGTYWNKYEEKSTLNGPRPYYAMLIGPRQNLALIVNKTKDATHYTNSYSEFNPTVVDYEILSDKNHKKGNFRPCKNSKHHIEKIQTERRNKEFEFCIAADFSNLPLTDHYILNKANYELSDKSYTITRIERNPDKTSDFTHIIAIASTSDSPKVSDLEITLNKTFPEWIANSHDSKGITAIPGKTFGIKPMLEGVQQAYANNKTKNNYYIKMTIKLEK